MKKQMFLAASVLFTAGVIFLAGCKKDDTTPPVIMLTGSSSVQSILNATYSDAGATAEDNEDGDITSSITVSDSVNKDLAGTYTLTYSVSDAAGNSATATRTVTVYNEAAYLAGSYATKDSVYDPSISTSSYSETVTASSAVNNRLWVTRFGNYDNGVVAIDRVSNTQITIPTISPSSSGQTVICGTSPNNFSRIFTNTFPSGGGTILTGATTVLQLDYKETVVTPTSTAYAVSIWTKQ